MSLDTLLASFNSLGEASASPSPSMSLKLSSPTAYASTVTRPLAGRKAALVMVALQAPEVVLQEETIWPPSATKLTVVPSGTGLLKWSDRRAVRVVITPSKFQPSMLSVVADSEKLSWSGIPVVTVNWSDWVVSVTPPEVTVVVSTPEEGAKPVTEAVTVSVPPQPTSRQDAVATPPPLV